MSGRMQTTYEEQGLRQMRYPKDRIAFLGTQTAVTADQAVMSKWVKGWIGIEQVCKDIAYNNFLDQYFPDGKIPRNMMINELRICGWLVETE